MHHAILRFKFVEFFFKKLFYGLINFLLAPFYFLKILHCSKSEKYHKRYTIIFADTNEFSITILFNAIFKDGHKKSQICN